MSWVAQDYCPGRKYRRVAADPYIDAASGVLRNKLGLADDMALLVAEAESASMNAPEALAFADRVRHLNEAALKRIHRILLADIYEWAGEFRTVFLSKAEGGLPFADPARLQGAMKARIIPAYYKLANRAQDDDRVLADALAQCWGELNELHPFREGNGRSTQIFVCALARRSGRTINWSKISHDAERVAAIASMQRDYSPYSFLLRSSLERWSPGLASSTAWITRRAD